MSLPDRADPLLRESPERVAVITGGSGDLAQATARQLQQEGWTVLAPPRAELDVRDPSRVRGWFARLDHVDLLVNNAGLRLDKPFGRLTDGDWDSVVGTCLTGALHCSRAAAVHMERQQSGHILNLGSLSAWGMPGQAAYAAAKAGLAGLTGSLAAEWGPLNIRVNCVLPGWLDTRFTADLGIAHREAARRRHALGRFNTATETARFLAFLATMEHVSGQVFQLDSRPASWL